jgi:hypothetical protein
MVLFSRLAGRVALSSVLGVAFLVGSASVGVASVSGRAAKTTVTLSGKVTVIGATRATGSGSFAGTRDGKRVSGGGTIAFTGKQKGDGAWHTSTATFTYSGTGARERFTTTGKATIRFPSEPSVNLGSFRFTAKGRANSFLGGGDDGQSI